MKLTWETRLGLGLITASVIIYLIKLQVLANPEVTINYIFNSLGFLPINVLIVTLIINQLLAMRSRREKLEKLNMVIGTFFSEVGTGLLATLSDHDPDLDEVRGDLIVRGDWTDDEFDALKKEMSAFNFSVSIPPAELESLRGWLVERRSFLIRLLENPVLLENESFTDLLRAVFHLTEELDRRPAIDSLPDSDLEHLAGDITRVYERLTLEWLNYMQYLRRTFPYLFSLAMRTNPFDEQASVVVG